MTMTSQTLTSVAASNGASGSPGRAARVTACANEVLAASGLLADAGPGANPYLMALADGSMSAGGFLASQEQFYFAVRYFPRPMAALIARMPDPASRLDILHNLVEEHGDFRPDRFHAHTFGQFLASLGGRAPDPDGPAMGPAVHAFNSVLASACGVDDPAVGVACMGIVEYAFADLSARIGQAVVAREWVPQDRLVHYALHAELDQRHAEEFFAIVEPRWDDPAGRVLVRRGLALGAYAFDQLYRGMAKVAAEARLEPT